MAGSVIRMDLARLPNFIRGVEGAASHLNIAPIVPKFRVAMVASTKQNFARGQSPDGTPFKPLLRPRVRGGDKPLRDRGILMASITSNTARGHIERVGQDTMEFGTNLDYAAIHQYGGVIQGKPALAIPETRAAERAGRPKNFPKKLVMVWPKRKPTGFLMEPPKNQNRRAKRVVRLVIHYLLVSRSKIDARPFLGWNEALILVCGYILIEFVEKKIEDQR